MTGERQRDDEFFVGYLPRQPAGVARWVRLAVGAAVVVAVAVALLLATAQRPFAAAFFEYGTVRSFQGRIQEGAVPLLWVGRPEAAEVEPSSPGPSAPPARSAYLLVAPGKHGAGPLVAGFDGREVRLRGTLVYRDGDTLLELEPGSVAPVTPGAPVAAPATALLLPGAVTLEGRIVDSKCYLGVMIPGEGKPHRDCAVRCIAGGVPPLLVVDDRAGGVRTLLLTGPGGRAINSEVLDFVAEPVRVSGELKRLDGKLVLEADPATLRRLR